MSRSYAWPAIVLGAAVVSVLGLTLLAWPRVATERERTIEAARAMAVAMIPSDAVDRSRVETRPTAYGWQVAFRGVQVHCSHTQFKCPQEGEAWRAPDPSTFRDAYVCVEYGTARAYMIVARPEPVGGVGPNTCQRPAGQAPRPTP